MKNLHLPFHIQTTALTLIFLMFMIGSTEIMLRFDFVNSRLAAPSFGSENDQFELQLARLKAMADKKEQLDCFFIGDSLVWLDMNPVRFREGYQVTSGKDIHCFNFGVAGLPASGVQRITEILVKEYQPRLIIYGLHANSVVVSKENSDTRIVLNTPWVKYMSGQFNPMGWLYENSFLVRYQYILNRLIHLDTEALTNENGRTPEQLSGFDAKKGQRISVHIPPSRDNPADVNGFEKYYYYQIYPENITAIQEIAKLADGKTRVVFVQMPVNPTFYTFFENGERDYLAIMNTIQEALAGTKASFLTLEDQNLFEDNDWWDYSHLNNAGADKFSYWLGQKVGMEAVGILSQGTDPGEK